MASATGNAGKPPPPTNPREVYHSFLTLSGEIGLPKPEEQTPREHQRTVAPTLPEPPVANIVDGFQEDYYGAREAGEGQMQGLLRDWNILQQYAAAVEKPETPPPEDSPADDSDEAKPGSG